MTDCSLCHHTRQCSGLPRGGDEAAGLSYGSQGLGLRVKSRHLGRRPALCTGGFLILSLVKSSLQQQLMVSLELGFLVTQPGAWAVTLVMGVVPSPLGLL